MMDQARTQIVDELLLEWEDHKTSELSPEQFCQQKEISDPETIAVFAKKAAALTFIDGLLSGSGKKAGSHPAGLCESTVKVCNTLQVDPAIAHGGRSSIHPALDMSLGRTIALKTLLSGTAESRDGGRLVQEAKVLGALQHPGILPVYQLASDSAGKSFYTMPMVQGNSLNMAIRDIHQDDRPTWDQRVIELIRRFVDVCQTAAYAHSRRWAHRDIKPENILLGEYGETFLVDWGLAKKIDEALESDDDFETNEPSVRDPVDQRLTQTGNSLGTPAFMSPEQARAERDLDLIASEVFNLGATLYTIVTGRPPYQGKTMAQVVRDAQQCNFAPPTSINKSIPRPIEAICLKAMDPDPASRYMTPVEMVDEINRWFDDAPVEAYRENLTERAARFNRKHGRWMMAGVAALLLIATTIGLAALQVNGQRKRADRSALVAWQSVNESMAEIQNNEFLRFSHLRPLRRELLQSTLEKYERLFADPLHHEQFDVELGNAYLRSAMIKRELDQLAAADRDFRFAAAIFDRIARRDPVNLEAVTKSIQCRIERLRMAASPDKQNQIARQLETTFQHPLLAATTANWIVSWQLTFNEIRFEQLSHSGDVSAATELLEHSRRLLEDTGSSNPAFNLHWANYYRLAASQATDDGARIEVLEHAATRFAAAIEHAGIQSDVALRWARPYSDVLHQLGSQQLSERRQDEAIEYFLLEQSLLQQLLVTYPTISDFRERFKAVALRLADLYRADQQLHEALWQFELAREHTLPTEAGHTQATHRVVQALIDLGQWHRSEGRNQESQATLIRAKREIESTNVDIPADTKRILGQVFLTVGVDQWLVGKGQAALVSFEQANQLFNELCAQLQPSWTDVNLRATSLLGISLSHALLENLDESITFCRLAIDGMHAVPESERGNDFYFGNHSAHFLLAAALERNGDAEQAERIRDSMVEFVPEASQLVVRLARAYAEEGQMYGRGKKSFSETDRFFLARYSEQSISLLKQAVEKGFADFDSIRNDPVFMPLYRYQEFRELVAGE